MAMRTYQLAELEDPAVRRAVARCLHRGGVVAYPTETFYGLGGDPRRLEVTQRIARLKGRPPGQPLPLIAADEEAVELWAAPATPEENRLRRRLAASFWPGPLALVLRARSGLAAGAVAADGTMAVRVPGLAGARRLAGLAGGLLVATSANPSGGAPVVEASLATAGLAGEIDLLLDGGATPGGQPSTLAAVAGGRLSILRQGAVPAAAVRQALEVGPAGTG